jgi:DNA-binding NtrC family response regulator
MMERRKIMIAPKNNAKSKSILMLGLQKQELELISKITAQLNINAETVQNDMDLWNHAQKNTHDLYILGQTDQIPDPSYLIWLLKGLSHNSKFILTYSNMNDDEKHRLDRYHAFSIFKRPIVANRLYDAIWSALNESTVQKSDFWSIVSGLNPRNWFNKHIQKRSRQKDK